MTVVVRRSHHVVDAAAISAANRIGSAALPFATLGEPRASPRERHGERAPGHYATMGPSARACDSGQSGAVRGAVHRLQPRNHVLRRRRGEVHNITIDNTYSGVEAFGLDTLVVDSLTYTAAAGTCVAEAVGSSESASWWYAARPSRVTSRRCTTGIDAFGVVQDLTVDA